MGKSSVGPKPGGVDNDCVDGGWIEAKTLWQGILWSEFRLRFAFRGYTPGCFAKSAQAFENVWVAEGQFSRVWKLLIKSGLREVVVRVVVRKDLSLGGVNRDAGRRFGR